MLGGGGSSNWQLNSNTEPFPSAFLDYASTVMPRSIREAMWWSEYLAVSNSVLGPANDRLISYFLTDLDITGDEVGHGEKEKYKKLFTKDHNFRFRVQEKAVGIDFLTYGNSFNSMFRPFRRFLACPRSNCGFERPYATIRSVPEYEYQWRNLFFVAKCPNCGYSGAFRVIDRIERDVKKLTVKRWNPKFIDIRYNPVTGNKRIIWRIPEEERQLIRLGYPHVLEDTPLEIIECVRKSANFEFDNNEIFHWWEEPLAGLRTYGWGLPRNLVNFRQAWYMAVIIRFNEAIGMDYIIPTRIVSPAPGKTSDPETGDLLQNITMGDISAIIEGMFRKTRRDPGRLNVSPIPLQYQMLGGDGKNLAPSELIEQSVSMLLNSIGFPVDFWKFDLKQEVTPLAARLMSTIWVCLVDGLNHFVQWTADKTSDIMRWEQIEVMHKRVEIFDRVEDPSIDLTLAGQELESPSSALSAMGKDYKFEQRQILEDKVFNQELQAKVQKQMDAASSMEQLVPTPLTQLFQAAAQGPQPGGGAPPQGGAPPTNGAAPQGGPTQASGPAGSAAQGMLAATPTGSTQRVTPQDVEAKAQYIADQMKRMPEGARQSAMSKLKHQDPMVHSRVKVMIEDINQQAGQQGKAQILTQQYGTT